MMQWRSGYSIRFALGFISQVNSYQKTLKMIFTASLLGAQQNRDRVENKPVSLLVVALGKALNGMPPSLCGRQVVGLSSLPVVVALVLLKTHKPIASTNAVYNIFLHNAHNK